MISWFLKEFRDMFAKMDDIVNNKPSPFKFLLITALLIAYIIAIFVTFLMLLMFALSLSLKNPTITVTFISLIFMYYYVKFLTKCAKKRKLRYTTYVREPVPLNIRQAVYTRDGYRCVYCDSPLNLEIDHIIPLSKGGPNHIDNYQTLCKYCNRKKSAKI